MEKFKKSLSTKLLDFVEGLPRFRKGVISDLQDIRERQRKWADNGIEGRSAPDDSNIKLSNITLVLTFEHEDYSSVTRGLKRYFTKNEKIEKFIASLKESEDSLHASSWHNLGYISKDKGAYFPDREFDNKLPEVVKGVSLSFHRILPSVACVIFEFFIEESVSDKLKKIQSKKYIGPVIFKKFWPPRYLSSGYTMGPKNQCAIEEIMQEKDSIRALLEKWIKQGFGWKPQTMDAVSYIDVFEIKGNPKVTDKRKEWIMNNSQWLEEHGISTREFNTYEGENFLLSSPRTERQKYLVTNAFAKLDSNSNSDFGEVLEYKVRAVAISSAIFSVIEKYVKRVEILRSHGFDNLYKRKKLNNRSQLNIQELKRTIAILSRLQHELEGSGNWIAHSISEIGELKDLGLDKPFNLGKSTLHNSKYQLDKVKEAADIVDTGLTNYLSVQSIHVMYKLQKWMLILSIVVTIATVVGVLSGWEDLKNLVPDEIWHNKQKQPDA